MKRFHLSSLLIVTVLAGAFIGANVVERRIGEPRLINDRIPVKYCKRGFPFVYEKCLQRLDDNSEDGLMLFDFKPTSLVWNAIAGLAALALIGYAAERFARRRRPLQ